MCVQVFKPTLGIFPPFFPFLFPTPHFFSLPFFPFLPSRGKGKRNRHVRGYIEELEIFVLAAQRSTKCQTEVSRIIYIYMGRSYCEFALVR